MHKVHLFNLGFMEYIKEKSGGMLLPPHCMHIVQPLDDTLFPLFKYEYQSQLMKINRLLSGHCMSRMDFLRVLVPAYVGAMTPEAIKSGSKNT